MGTYIVTYREALYFTVEVEADSYEEAKMEALGAPNRQPLYGEDSHFDILEVVAVE